MIRIVTIAAAAIAATACNARAETKDRDPGSSVSRNYQLGAFDKIEIAGPYDVTVTTGGSPGASATGGSNLLDETDVFVEGSTLKIQPKKKDGFRWSWGKSSKAHFNVTTAMLHGAQIAGSGTTAVDKVDGDFEGGVAGSGDLRLAAVNGGTVEFTVAGSGKIAAAGKSTSTKIDIAGSGDVDASGLAATNADVSIAGSGNVRANASRVAKVEIMGSGDVVITGGAKCSVHKAGSGDVTCG
jgi:hypothetical protein